MVDDLLDTAPCGFVSFADDGTILLVNTTLARWLGRAPAELEGRRVASLLPASGGVFYQTHLFPLLKMSGKLDEIYLALRAESGEEVPVLANAVRRERAGTFVNDCVLVPMRRRDRYEDELLLARKAAEEARAQLAAANERLRQLDEFKDELLAVTSHDLRSLVATIRMVAQMLLDEKRAARIDQGRYIKTIAEATDRLLILLNDLSDLTMINTGELRLQKRQLLLSEVARAAARDLAVRADAKSIDVSVDAAEVEPPVEGDYNRLYQVASNLLGNAIKFTPAGGRISVGVRPDAEGVALSVSDTGIGIPTPLLAELFDHFKNPTRHGTAGERGSGLGLTIVRRLVEVHGGRIEARSEEGRGSTFTIRLPAARPDAQPVL